MLFTGLTGSAASIGSCEVVRIVAKVFGERYGRDRKVGIGLRNTHLVLKGTATAISYKPIGRVFLPVLLFR